MTPFVQQSLYFFFYAHMGLEKISGFRVRNTENQAMHNEVWGCAEIFPKVDISLRFFIISQPNIGRKKLRNES